MGTAVNCFTSVTVIIGHKTICLEETKLRQIVQSESGYDKTYDATFIKNEISWNRISNLLGLDSPGGVPESKGTGRRSGETMHGS